MNEEHLGYLIRTLANKFGAQFEIYKSIHKFEDLSRVNGWIMRYLYNNKDKDIFQKDIENSFDINRSTTSAVLKNMEQKGYIERISIKEDARLKKIILTLKGEKTHEQIINDLDFLDSTAVRNIDKDELAIFYKVVKQLTKNVDENIKYKFENIK